MDIGATASSSRQGGRVIHPLYAKHGIKDGKGSSELPSNIFGERKLNVCTHPSAVNPRSLSVRYSSKNCKTLTHLDRQGYHLRQKFSSEFSPADSKLMTVPSSGNRMYSEPMTICDDQPSTSTASDHITEKNKKSSVEPKRFYQRKFSGFSGIKLPVGKFFKLLRPDLQRRNSCPVISLPELQLGDKLNSALNSKLENGLDPNLTQNGEANNQKNLKCRLTKWTSHSELLHLEIKRQNIACDLPYGKAKTVAFQTLNSHLNTPTSPSESTKPNGLSYSKTVTVEPAPLNKSLEIGEESDCVRNFITGSHKTSLEKFKNVQREPSSLEKTVIVVSKNSRQTLGGSNENNFENCRPGTSCYISNTETSMPSMDYELLHLQTECNEISRIECNRSEKEGSVLSDKIKVINTLPLQNDQKIRGSNDFKQKHVFPTNPGFELEPSNIDEYGESGLQKVNIVETFNQHQNINVYTSDNTNLELYRLDYSINLENNNKCSIKTVQEKENTYRDVSNHESNDKIHGLIVIQNENLNTKQTISLHTTSEENSDNCDSVLLNSQNYTSALNFQSDSYNSDERNQENFHAEPIYATVKKDWNNTSDRYWCDTNHQVKHVDFSKAAQAHSECGVNRTVAYIGSSTAHSTDKHTIESVNVDTHSNNESISFNISRSQNEDDHPKPINIICNEMGNKNLPEMEIKDNLCQNSEVEVTCQPDSLNFGECSSNTSLTDIQNRHITECYNVKLDAPEEVIVAGFHDFCQTTLSLEESIEMQDSATIKRKTKGKDKKIYSATELNDTKSLANPQSNERNNKHENIETKTTKLTDDLVEGKKSSTEAENTSDKLLEEIQNSKLLGKMNIKDPDVIEAIRALDKSLMEISEEFPEPETDNSLISELGQPSEGIKGKPISNITAKVIREDKIQCDNLIEEVTLEDISKRVKNDYQRSIKSEIAVTISNNNVQLNSEVEAQNLETDSNTNSQQKLQDSENHDYWLSKKLGNYHKASNIISDASISNLEELSSDTGSSDNCETKEVKKFNVASDVDNGSYPYPTTMESGNSSVVYPLQVSVDHSQGALQVGATSNRTSPCSVDSGTSSHNQSFFVVVAIDFGTTYSGYAFSFTRDPDNIHMMKKWDGGDPGVFNQKTPTTLLLSPEGTFHSFGYSARDYYHDLDEEEAKEWLYFEKFKMALHHSEYLSLDTTIAAANGKCTSAVTVFAHALRYFKEHALQELTDQSSTKILNEDVRWVVTVPAIWKQPAKQFMRAAAYKAGIASPDYPEQLLIALEPEAASIYCRRIRLHQLVPDETHFQRSSFQWQKDKDTDLEAGSTKSDKDFGSYSLSGQGYEDSFTTGTRYMVVDCGGGTVDITVHELLDRQGALKELQKASGGPYGSIGVDIEFEKLLCEIFGEDFMQEFKAKRPIGFLDLMVAFEARKRNANPYKNNSLNISLPFSFVDFYKSYTGLSVETAMKNSSHKNVKWSAQGMLRLEPSAMESLFRKTVENIRKHIENIINQKDMNIEHIFLVGGFAESLILQKEIKDSFSNTQKVIIPQGVSLAILKGAVLFGLDPTTINIRRLRMTYGVGVLNRFIHGVHPKEKLVVKDGIQWCADVFDKFVVNEQSVDVGDVVLRRYTPAKDGQSCSVIHIYCSEKDNAYFITDNGVKRCATLILDLSESRYVKGREIQTQMMFGDTEIKVSALDVTTGKCVKAEVDFLNQ